jgi:hypothetical protein
MTRIAIVVASLLAAAPAAAHPIVDEGRSLAHEARFEEALAAFARAEAASDLTRSDVIALLEGRALVHFALGQEAELARALSALASVAPDHAPDRAIPPDLATRIREACATVREPLALRSGAERAGSVARVRADVVGDEVGLVRAVRVHVREGEGGFRTLGGRVQEVVADPRVPFAWYAEAIGPGGAVLASDGTREAPHGLAPDLSPARVASEGGATEGERGASEGTGGSGEDDGGGPGPWPYVIAGGVLAVAVAVVLMVLFIPGSDTQPSAPSFPL